MGQEAGGDVDVQVKVSGGHKAGDLLGALGVAGAEAAGISGLWGQPQGISLLQLPQVPDGELEDISLLQLGDGLSFSLQLSHHEIL